MKLSHPQPPNTLYILLQPTLASASVSKMRLSLTNVFLLCLLSPFCIQGKAFETNEEEEPSKSDQWKELLNWIRENARRNESRDDFVEPKDASYELGSEEEANGTDFEMFGRNVRAIDAILNEETATPEYVENGIQKEEPEEEIPIRGASLAFVFDSTGSMADELSQVKVGAAKILAALRDHPDAPIYNYIWVPFNDPDIGPVTVTTNHKEFRDKMEKLVVTGGGDCPENSMAGLKKALEVSLPNSYVYVFTDAFAKDHMLVNDVLSLVQRKHIQVVFILTGDCGGVSAPGYHVYERITEMSSGQIYRLNRQEVAQVLQYVKIALQPHAVSLVSLKKPAPPKTNPDKLEVVVDKSLKRLTVSVSGTNASMKVTDPQGINVEGPPKLEKVVNLNNIQVVNIKEPDPGQWKVYVTSDSDYSLRLTGLSKINFKYGFSTEEAVNLKTTNHRPLKGAESYILIQSHDADKVFNLTTVDIVSSADEILQTLDLVPVPGTRGLYKAGPVVPPLDLFYLGVSAFGQDGLPIKRLTPTAISAQLPEKPIVTMKANAVGRVNHSGSLRCRVESVVPVAVRWYKNGVLLQEGQNCSETCEVVLNFDKFSADSEGKYTCGARNLAGSDAKTLVLTITGDPPKVKVNSPVIASLGQTVHLNCSVESTIPYTVKWTQLTVTNQHSGILHLTSTGVKLENNTLLIESVKTEDEGWYVCVAGNREGESEGRVLLVIKEPLLVKVEPNILNFAEGDAARFVCSASGKPPPRLEWFKDEQQIKDEDPSIFVEEINGKLNLAIEYLEKRNAGSYMCVATNPEESVSAIAELIYTEKPTVKAKENNLMVKTGSQVVLECTATGKPKPTIIWRKRGVEISNDSKFQVDEGTLKIESAESSDAGEYSCLAKNDLGSEEDFIGLIIGSLPSFLQKPKDKKIHINHNGTIACSAFGTPLPEIKWSRADGKNLDSDRMFILPSGALKITRMRFEDGGRYICTAENVFGSVRKEASIKASGIEKPIPDKNMELTSVKALSGSELKIPCGIVLGNPPAKVKWLKDDVELEASEKVAVDGSGNLVIRNATTADRGSYVCSAENVVGKSSRPFEIVISESPKIMETNNTELKATVGGEVVIPCPVEGFPVPSVTWTKNGLPLPMSSTILQNERGSLIIRNLTEDSGGVYECIAINSVGSASRTTSIHVQVPPVYSDDVPDSPVNVVEGHVVVLNCNVSAVPEPQIQWFKNEEPLLQDGEQPKILRFVANVDDTGTFKCTATNEAGSASKEFNVTILVPPKIMGRKSEESIRAKAGVPITLVCNVFGVPPPTILWQRNGMYLTQNSSDVTISDSGLLTIRNVTKESTGAYTCDAENLGGITQRIYYLHVNYAPKIIDDGNVSKSITLKEGEEYSLSCLVEGNPKPTVLWKKNGIPIHDHQNDLIVHEDNTLVFLQVTRETTGIYKCEATSTEGSTSKEYEIEVMTPPSLITSDFYRTKLEVNEGDSLALTCPTTFSKPKPNIQWIKNGEPLDTLLQERSDEAQMKLSPDQRTLIIVEAHPSDKGNYSCVATNAAGRTDAKFLVEILMTPHFEEFNHIAHRTILTGGQVVLNCSVSGNPQPKVTWRKENTSITPYNTPGVHVSLDKQHLTIANGKIHHTGTYICLATNKVKTKEREFYVTVLEPPQIEGSLQQTIDVMKGDNVTLHCQGSGVPAPTFTWTKQDDHSKKTLNNSEEFLRIANANCEDGGLYLCDVTNTAGTRTKHFQLNVLEIPEIENQDLVDEVTGVLAGNITIKCKTSGNPKPELTWFHNGHILRKRSIRSDDGYASLDLINVQERDKGTYVLLASNEAGVVEKRFHVQILVPPTVLDGREDVGFLRVIHPFPIVLKCPVHADPTPLILWFFGDLTGDHLRQNENVAIRGGELRIKNSNSRDSGIYICLAENPGGSLTYYFNVSVVEPPSISGNGKAILNLAVNDTLVLHCNTTGNGKLKYSWFHGSVPLKNESEVFITNLGRTLTISNMQLKNSGLYYCVATNMAGSAESTYEIEVLEPPELSDQSSSEEHKLVQLHHPFSLYCFFNGHPPPEITWYKDGHIFNPIHSTNSVLSDNSYLTFPSSRAEDSGDYKCVARNRAGVKELNFKVDVIASGEWTHWSEWSPCSVTCGLGHQIRRRSCSVENARYHPRLKIDKTRCKGDDFTKRNCFKDCQVNGGWGNWGSWTSCSNTCGQGIRRRYRLCDAPKPRDNGRGCEGEDSEEEKCFKQECPINGQWSGWSEWSECSDSCGSGVMQRLRKCDSPSPQNGGADCPGWATQIKTCNKNKCEEVEKWSSWSEWSPCSQTCGRGRRKRYRKCESIDPENDCKGNDLEIERCFTRNCVNTTFPSAANLYVTGELNGNPIDNRFDVSIENLENERQISANMNDLLKNQEKWFPYSPFLLSPLSWNAAYEMDNADNGYSLTDGNFFSQSDIQFATGEGLTVKHKGDGVDEDGTLLVEIEVIGEVPLVEPHSSVVIQPIEQDFVQTGSNTLYSSSHNDVTVEGKRLPFSWNSSIHYDGSKGTMPYLVEKLSMKGISSTYNPESQNVSFTASSSIGKKFENDHCPPGFFHDPNYMHCQDVNECERSKNLCKVNEVCENTFGSYTCVCRKGFKRSHEGCLDVDECSQKNHLCSHYCHNIPGSFMCSCPFGFYLSYDLRTCVEISRPPDDVFYDEEPDHQDKSQLPGRNMTTADRFSYGNDRLQEYIPTRGVSCPPGYFFIKNECKDFNECKGYPNICDKDEICINVPGSFQCLSIPCPLGYERTFPNKNCLKKCTPNNKCKRGATVSESLIFHPLTLNDSNTTVVYLDEIVKVHCNAVKTRYRVTESDEIFDVKVSNGRSFLYAKRNLNRETLYRVKIEAFSYGLSDVLLYFTEFVLFITVA